MGKLRIGLVGCGNWGRHICRDLVALGAEVWAVARSEASRARAREQGAAGIVPDLESLGAMDGYVVATPTRTHAQVVAELLPRGAPLFVEKPLCCDAGQARELVRAGGDRIFVMDKWRYHRGVETLAAIARSGELGPVQGLKTTRQGWGNPHADVDCAWILLPHDLAIGLEVLGFLPAPRLAVGEQADGRLAGVTAILGTDPWQVADIGVRSPVSRRRVELHCRDGVAVLADAYADGIEIIPNPPSLDAAGEARVVRRPVDTEMPLKSELAAFLGFLRGGPAPRSSADEALAVVDAVAEIRRMALNEDPPA